MDIRRAIIILSLAVPSAYAVDPGFYMGLMTGPARANANTLQAQVARNVFVTARPQNNAWGSRLYLGYKFTKYAASELGLTYFSTFRYNTSGIKTCTGTNARTRNFDLVVKGNLQAWDFEVFGKAGVAVTYLTTSGAINPGSNPKNLDCGNNVNTTKYNPTFTIGASYDLTQNWVADITWNRTMVGSPINSVNLYALGISYHFVNIYCGQFLC
jgi:opacity protein-like surface antigen